MGSRREDKLTRLDTDEERSELRMYALRREGWTLGPALPGLDERLDRRGEGVREDAQEMQAGHAPRCNRRPDRDRWGEEFVSKEWVKEPMILGLQLDYTRWWHFRNIYRMTRMAAAAMPSREKGQAAGWKVRGQNAEPDRLICNDGSKEPRG